MPTNPPPAPAPTPKCVFASIDGVACCDTHWIALDHGATGWRCPETGAVFPFGAAFGTVGAAPAPTPAEGLRQLIAQWRSEAFAMTLAATANPDRRGANSGHDQAAAAVYRHVANELEAALSAVAPALPTGIRWFPVNICDECYALKGEMCHNAGCVFCRRTMAEVGEMLDALLLRPVVDGERLDLHPLPAAALPPAGGEENR